MYQGCRERGSVCLRSGEIAANYSCTKENYYGLIRCTCVLWVASFGGEQIALIAQPLHVGTYLITRPYICFNTYCTTSRNAIRLYSKWFKCRASLKSLKSRTFLKMRNSKVCICNILKKEKFLRNLAVEEF